MTDRAAFRAQLIELYGEKSRWSLSKQAAADLGVDQRTVYRWLLGEVPIPDIAVKCVALMLVEKHLEAELASWQPDLGSNL